MDFNDLLNHDDKSEEVQKPEISHQRSSINILLNTDTKPQDEEQSYFAKHHHPIQPTITNDSPRLSHKPSLETLKRSSIASITNDIDIDIDGNQTLNVVRRSSFGQSSSEATSPVVTKTTMNHLISDQSIDESPEMTFKSPKVEHRDSHIESNIKRENSKKTDQSEQPANKKENFDKKADLKSELEKLDKKKEVLKGKKKKPKKYDSPPIWATEWIPPFKKKGRAAKTSAPPSKYSDLENSVTGKTPYEDLSRRVGQWLYAHFEHLQESDYPYVELEAKLGRIWDKSSDQRIQLPVSTECLVVDSVNYTFKPGIEEPMFNKLTRFLTDLEASNKQGRKFSTLNYKNEDKFYKESIKNMPPRNIRVTRDLDSKRDTAIEKKRVASLFMHLPDSAVDIRLSLSLELPVQVTDKFSKIKPNLTRLKTRTSYIHSKTCSRFDLTRVNTESKKGPEISHEVEIEADIIQLIESYKMVKSQTDIFRYEEIVKIILDNARLTSREVSKK